MRRYEPFSGAHRLHDAPVFHRAGSTVLVFLEPQEVTVSNTSRPGSGGPTQGNKPAGGSGTRPGGGASTSPSKPRDPGK